MQKVLTYLGGGSLNGVPARDLTEAEVKRCGGAERLIASALYAAVEQPKPQGKKREVKADDRRA